MKKVYVSPEVEISLFELDKVLNNGSATPGGDDVVVGGGGGSGSGGGVDMPEVEM